MLDGVEQKSEAGPKPRRYARRLSPVERLVVVEIYANQDATAYELADVYGCSHQTIYNILGDHVKRKRITTPEVREQVQLWVKRTRMTKTEIARRVELGRSTVYYILNGRKKNASKRLDQAKDGHHAQADGLAKEGTSGGSDI